MCDADPDCYGYDVKGMLYRKGDLIDDPEASFFIKLLFVCFDKVVIIRDYLFSILASRAVLLNMEQRNCATVSYIIQ